MHDFPPFPINPTRHALFLDFDGTLVDIAERPDAVRLEPEARETLGFLSAALGGALAIVTGREIPDVDRYLDPLQLPVAGVHGQTRRNAIGTVIDCAVPSRFTGAISLVLAPFADSYPGVLIERKRGAVALHYRLRPEIEELAIAAMTRAAAGYTGIELIRGKMVIEAKSSAIHKGHAVEAYLNEKPFQGRVPIVAGDDQTDEDAFRTVNRLGGVSIKVGDGDSAAMLRVPNAAALRNWLAQQQLRLQSLPHHLDSQMA